MSDLDIELRVVINKTDYLRYGRRFDRILSEGDTISFMGFG
jgi:hypothetical protein